MIIDIFSSTGAFFVGALIGIGLYIGRRTR